MSVASIIAFLLILGGLKGIHFWERKRLVAREPDEEDLLTLLARMEGTSELEQFRLAGESWNMPQRRIDADFDNYLLSSSPPHYVRDYLRRKREELPDLEQLLDTLRDLLTCPPGPSSNFPWRGAFDLPIAAMP